MKMSLWSAAVVLGALGPVAQGQPRSGGQPGVEEYRGPRIVVRRGGAPARAAGADRRVIGVPANTVFAGPPLWYIRELQSAEVRTARATARWVEAQAERVRARGRFGGPVSTFLYIDPLIYPWPAAPLGYGLDTVPMEPEGVEGTGAPEAQPVEREGAAEPAHIFIGSREQEYAGPSIVVHRNGAATPARGAATTIHLPGGTVAVGRALRGRAVPVPANTLHRGVPLWYTRGLQEADVRIARATADWVEAQAERAERRGRRWR